MSGPHADVALKVLRNVTPSALYHFKQEFRSLAAFRHENVVRLYELLFAQGEWMFTMELIDGLPFHRYVNRSSDPLVLRRTICQLIDGISALHAGGFLASRRETLECAGDQRRPSRGRRFRTGSRLERL